VAFSILIYLSSGSPLKATLIALVGMFMGSIGTDFITGDRRFNYGSLTLSDGIGLIPVVMGIFGIAEIMENLEREVKETTVLYSKVKNLLPTLQDWKESIASIFRGTLSVSSWG
jgi:putative tricarboxylic transport membrane protein